MNSQTHHRLLATTLFSFGWQETQCLERCTLIFGPQGFNPIFGRWIPDDTFSKGSSQGSLGAVEVVLLDDGIQVETFDDRLPFQSRPSPVDVDDLTIAFDSGVLGKIGMVCSIGASRTLSSLLGLRPGVLSRVCGVLSCHIVFVPSDVKLMRPSGCMCRDLQVSWASSHLYQELYTFGMLLTLLENC